MFNRDHSRNFTFWTNKKIYIIDHSFILGSIAKVLSPGPFQNHHILDHYFFSFFLGSSRIFMFLFFPRISSFGPFQNFYILNHSRFITLWIVPEFLHTGPLQTFYILDCSKKIMFWFNPELLFYFRTILEFVPSVPFQKIHQISNGVWKVSYSVM